MSKSHYSAKELAGLPGMPSTERTVKRHAAASKWRAQARTGKGGGVGYLLADLPEETQAALVERHLSTPAAATSAGALPVGASGSLPVRPATTALAKTSSSGASAVTGKAPTKLAIASPRLNLTTTADNLTEAQRDNGAARLTLLRAVYALRANGLALQKACDAVARNATRGTLAPELQSLLSVANARGDAISARTLMRWHGYLQSAADNPSAQITALAEIVPVKTLALPPDVLGTIALLDTSGNSLSAACRKYARANGFIHDEVEINRLYHRATRALRDKVPASVMHKRRHTGAGLTAKKPHVTRSTANLLPNDIRVTDGHSMKAPWAHPETGKPFTPEFTAVEDWATRKVVGWSVSLSENALAVREAQLNAIRDFGVPGITYSDGGSGQTAKDMDDPVRGFYATFGIDHRTGRPGNPQGRGVIERAWASHAMEVAQENPLFRGKTVDRDTLRRNTIALDKSLRLAKRDPSNVVPINQLPPFTQFIERMTQAIDEYNSRPHRGLPKNDATGLHFSPNDYWAHLATHPDCAFETVSVDAQRLMFMPYLIVPARRGRVTLFKKYYGHADLYTLADEKHVRVYYDVTDPRLTWITDLEGRFLCEATIDANTRDAFPMSVVEQTRLRRIDNQAKRLQGKADDLAEERAGIVHYSAQAFARPDLPVLDVEDDATVVPIKPEPEADARPARFADELDKFRWLMAHRDAVTDSDTNWLRGFASSALYRDCEEIFEREGIAYGPAHGAGGEVFKVAAA